MKPRNDMLDTHNAISMPLSLSDRPERGKRWLSLLQPLTPAQSRFVRRYFFVVVRLALHYKKKKKNGPAMVLVNTGRQGSKLQNMVSRDFSAQQKREWEGQTTWTLREEHMIEVRARD